MCTTTGTARKLFFLQYFMILCQHLSLKASLKALRCRGSFLCVLCIVVGRLFLNEESEGKVLTHYCCDISHCGSVYCASPRCCHVWHLPSQAYSTLWSSQLLKATSPVYRDFCQEGDLLPALGTTSPEKWRNCL